MRTGIAIGASASMPIATRYGSIVATSTRPAPTATAITAPPEAFGESSRSRQRVRRVEGAGSGTATRGAVVRGMPVSGETSPSSEGVAPIPAEEAADAASVAFDDEPPMKKAATRSAAPTTRRAIWPPVEDRKSWATSTRFTSPSVKRMPTAR